MTKEERKVKALEDIAQAEWERSDGCTEATRFNLGYRELWKSGWKAGFQKAKEAAIEMVNEAVERVSDATQEG